MMITLFSRSCLEDDLSFSPSLKAVLCSAVMASMLLPWERWGVEAEPGSFGCGRGCSC